MKHGITPPLKNVRKRRFRKTMKKKFMDMPEIEKEVKRLLRVDAEAADVSWEVVADPEEGVQGSTVSKTDAGPSSTTSVAAATASMLGSTGAGANTGDGAAESSYMGGAGGAGAAARNVGSGREKSNLLSIAAQEIFGELSDSDEEAAAVEAAERDQQLESGSRSRVGSLSAAGDVSSDFDLELSGGGGTSVCGQEVDSNSGHAPTAQQQLHFTAPLPEGLMGGDADEAGGAGNGAGASFCDEFDLQAPNFDAPVAGGSGGDASGILSPAKLTKISQQVRHLTKEIQSLKNKIGIRQSQLTEHTDNETFRQKMEADIYTYRSQLSDKRRQYERLSGLLELAGRADLT